MREARGEARWGQRVADLAQMIGSPGRLRQGLPGSRRDAHQPVVLPLSRRLTDVPDIGPGHPKQIRLPAVARVAEARNVSDVGMLLVELPGISGGEIAERPRGQ